MNISIHRGLPEAYCRQAAEVYYQAFRQKFKHLMGDKEHIVCENGFHFLYLEVVDTNPGARRLY